MPPEEDEAPFVLELEEVRIGLPETVFLVLRDPPLASKTVLEGCVVAGRRPIPTEYGDVVLEVGVEGVEEVDDGGVLAGFIR